MKKTKSRPTTLASSSAKTAARFRSSKKKAKNPPKLNLVPFARPWVQEDVLEQLEIMKKLTEEGKLVSVVLYYELHTGGYHIHMTGCEDTLKTGSRLMSMGLARLGH
jgi:hypothetical protein